jgi:uncharacterized protein
MNDESQMQSLRSFAKRSIARYKRPRAIGAPTLVTSRFNILVALADGGALIFNSMTRAMSRLTTVELALYRTLEREGSAGVDSQTSNIDLDQLHHDGFLVPESRDELAAFRAHYYAARQSTDTMTLTIAPTMACNLACGYCFQGQQKDLRKIGSDVPDAIYDLVAHHSDHLSGLNIAWYGGEPLMGKETIFALSDRLISLCDKKNINYSASIVTNGYFLTSEVAQQLYTRRCTYAQVTIDGVRDTHDRMRPLLSGRGSWDRIMGNLDAVLDSTPMAINVRVNVGQSNVNECGTLLEEFEKRNFAAKGKFSVYFAPIDASTPEAGSAYEDALAKSAYSKAVLGLGEQARVAGFAGMITPPAGIMGMCVAAQDQGYVIAPNGDVHKCWETAHDPDKRTGTIFEPEGLKGSPNAQLWDAWSPFDNPVCTSCRILPMCGGHCPHRFVYADSGDSNSLPCPDWKWNTAEYLFARAKALGAVSDDQWLAHQATVTAEQSGRRHHPVTLKEAQTVMLRRVAENNGDPDSSTFVSLVQPQIVKTGR